MGKFWFGRRAKRPFPSNHVKETAVFFCALSTAEDEDDSIKLIGVY